MWTGLNVPPRMPIVCMELPENKKFLSGVSQRQAMAPYLCLVPVSGAISACICSFVAGRQGMLSPACFCLLRGVRLRGLMDRIRP